jgi:hypothetical protein
MVMEIENIEVKVSAGEEGGVRLDMGDQLTLNLPVPVAYKLAEAIIAQLHKQGALRNTI